MTAYANLHGDSGVRSYEFEASALIVMFKDRSLYRYGGEAADQMKQLAQSGRGLNTFINVRKPSFEKIG